MTATMKIDRHIFFNRVRETVPEFGHRLTTAQVANMTCILDAIEDYGITNRFWAGHILATALTETGKAMAPVREGFASTDRGARAIVSRAKRAYAKVIDGNVYYGRGYVQLTWASNYAKAELWAEVPGLKADPDKALIPAIAARILVIGSMQGQFTGKAVPDFGSDALYRAFDSRAVVNGDKNKVRKGSSQPIGVEFKNRLFRFAAAIEFTVQTETVTIPLDPPVLPKVPVTLPEPPKPVTHIKGGWAPFPAPAKPVEQAPAVGYNAPIASPSNGVSHMSIFSNYSKWASAARHIIGIVGGVAVGLGAAKTGDVQSIQNAIDAVGNGIVAVGGAVVAVSAIAAGVIAKIKG